MQAAPPERFVRCNTIGAIMSTLPERMLARANNPGISVELQSTIRGWARAVEHLYDKITRRAEGDNMTRWQQIIFLRLVFGWTFERIGIAYSMSRQRVHQIYSKHLAFFDLDECLDCIKI